MLISEWFPRLPEPYRSACQKYFEAQRRSDIEVNSISAALNHAFIWIKTPQGYGFWSTLNNELHLHFKDADEDTEDQVILDDFNWPELPEYDYVENTIPRKDLGISDKSANYLNL